MKRRLKLAALALACIATATATTIPITLTAPEGSGTKVDYDNDTKVYTLTIGAPAQKQIVRTNSSSAVWPSDVLYLKFDYITSGQLVNIPASAYKCGTSGAETHPREITGVFSVSDKWQFYNLYLSTWRRRIKFGERTGQYLDIDFSALPEGSVVKLRNPRWSSDAEAFAETNITNGGDVIIEAEHFDSAIKETLYRSNQLDYPARTRYKNPTGDRFPIYSWGYLEYQYAGVVDGVDVGVANMKKQYQEMAECGFTCTQGTAYAAIDECALFTDHCCNGSVPIYLFEDLDMWMIVKADMDANPYRAKDYKKSPHLGGYFIYDEPRFSDFPAMRNKLERIMKYDDENLFYGNLININTDMSYIGATSYDHYVREFVNQVGLNMLSFDYYPVRQYIDTKEIFLCDDYFMNLEIVAKLAKYYDMPFWSFVHSTSSKCANANHQYPYPTEEHMRVQAFMSLAYGAQGIQYYTYQRERDISYDYDNAPIDWDGNKTPVWYSVQAINRDIHALTDVFLGAQMLRVGFTHATTPKGCTHLTDDMLPEGVTSVSSDGEGVCVSILQNGTKQYMMIVNTDIHNNQNVTIGLNSKLTQIKTDGTLAEVSGEQKNVLTPGAHLVYLVNDKAPAIDRLEQPEPFDRSNYRPDATSVIVTANDQASGGHFLPDMGDRVWNAFSGIMPDASSHVITEDDAIANWGSFYSYSITASEDVDINIFVGHSVPWSEYGRVASTGATPGYGYMVENNPTLNWPKAYAAAMKLELDGKDLTPANQPLRPAVPETFDPAGTEFNRILADKSLWVSTANADNTPSDVLYFWPKEGGKDDVEFQYNELPDYQNVHLTAGEHKITVKSLSYPWHFDALKIDTKTYSGIEAIGADTDENAPVEWFNLQGIRINPDNAAPGLYLRRQGTKTTKVIL